MDKLRMLLSRFTVPLALVALVLAMGGTWHTSASAAPLTVATAPPPRASPRTSPPRGSPARPAPAIAAASQAPVTRPSPADGPPPPPRARPAKKPPTGRLNLNTATADQLLMLPTVGPAKADRIVTWRRKNGGFKRVADLRRVKGFGYRTFKRLEPLLAVQGDTTLAYP